MENTVYFDCGAFRQEVYDFMTIITLPNQYGQMDS